MSPLDAIRWKGAHWFVPVVFAVGILVGLTGASYPVDFGVANLASASVSMTFTGPLSAAYMAAAVLLLSRLLDGGSTVKEWVDEPARSMVAHRSWNPCGCRSGSVCRCAHRTV